MIQWIDRKYIQLLSGRLDGFKQKSANLFNCRCIFCGDSETNQNKKRGYFYIKENHFIYYCHNCHYSSGIKNILKKLDYRLYEQYILESLSSKQDEKDVIYKSNIAARFDHDEATSALRKLQKISQLDWDHPAKKYIEARKIPTPYHSVIRWCPNFMHFSNYLKPGKFDEKTLIFDEARILVPFFDKDNKFFAYVGRAIGDVKNGIRYILIILNYDVPLIYGLNGFQTKKLGYAFEGPIDAMFIPNSIAMAGSNVSILTNLPDHDNLVVVFDNEPRKSETKSKILQAIDLNYKVCVWPGWVEHKDINAMVIAGWTPEYIKEVIDDNTYQGFEAKIRLEQWSRK